MRSWVEERPSLEHLVTADSFGKPDLEVFVEQLPTQRHPVGEHCGRHQADGLPVHQEPLDGRKRQVVGEASELNPEANVCSTPPPGVKREAGAVSGSRRLSTALLHNKVEWLGGIEGVHLHLLLRVHWGSGEPRNFHLSTRRTWNHLAIC